MKKTYIVTSIANKRILVSPEQQILPESPLNPYGIEVINPYNLQIKEGDRVRIGLSAKTEAINGIFALIMPIFLAFLGNFLSPFIANLIHTEATVFFKTLVISVFFAIPCFVIFLISRSLPTITKLKIRAVV